MLRHRKILLVIASVLVIGSISTTLGYALHVRSDGYRIRLESRLSELLRMRLSIESIQPLTLAAKRLDGLSLWLPKHEVEVFRCERALWRTETTNGHTSYTLSLHRGRLLVGNNQWDRSDYVTLLRSGLAHDFAALRLRRIQLDDIDVIWKHPSVELTADRTRGSIYFEPDGTGRASLLADYLNGVRVTKPINIVAHFTPGEQLRFHEVVMKIPEAPLSSLKLDALLGAAVTQGHFRGDISYVEQAVAPRITVGGEIRDALLRELTGLVPGGPYEGRVDITVDEASFSGRQLMALRFNGRLSGLSVAQFGRLLGHPELTGHLDLRVHRVVYDDASIRYLSVEGRATDVSLEALTSLVGRGRVTGSLDAIIHSLVIVDDRIVVAELTLEAVPPDGRPGTINREVLKAASERMLGFDATKILPAAIQEVEYARLGVHLKFSQGELRVQGTHGDDGKTILTVSLFGREFGVIKEPSKTYDIGDPIARLRGKTDQYDVQQWLRTWRDRSASPSEENGDD
ncbi:MAG: hypothetical protein IIC46_00420 [Planctomycetes bacterium]|nr:hypothetical protein [Planctomycetota bacterium]